MSADNPMAAQLKRYQARRAAATAAEGWRPCCWYRQYQRSLTSDAELSQAEITKDAARMARLHEAATDANA